jgi:hypothetical protein
LGIFASNILKNSKMLFRRGRSCVLVMRKDLVDLALDHAEHSEAHRPSIRRARLALRHGKDAVVAGRPAPILRAFQKAYAATRAYIFRRLPVLDLKLSVAARTELAHDRLRPAQWRGERYARGRPRGHREFLSRVEV